MHSCFRRFHQIALVGLSCFVAGQTSGAPSAATPKPPLIVLIGDSTTAPNGGWGPAFEKFLINGATAANAARAGRSSKSYIAEGHWAKALALKGDYYLIQFGHNDEPGKGPERETDPATTYAANLARFVDEVIAAGGKPILVTSLTRRKFSATHPGKIETSLTPYAEATKRVAAEKHIPCLDLHARSIALCETLGPDETAKLNPIKKDGSVDRTHLGPAGEFVFARLVLEDLRAAAPELAPFLVVNPVAPATTERGTGSEDGALPDRPTPAATR